LLLGVPETSVDAGGRGEDQPHVASLGCPYHLYTSALEFTEPAALDEISLQPDEFYTNLFSHLFVKKIKKPMQIQQAALNFPGL